MSNVYDVLKQAFRSSHYLHSVGSGDEQALELVIDAAGELIDNSDDEVSSNQTAQAFIAGAIMSRAMCDLWTAMDAAEELLINDLEDNR